MTNSNSLARAKHAAKHETTAQARQAAAAKKKDYDKTADSLERGRSLVRERQAAVEGLNAAEAALVGPDYLPSPPEREARRDAEDALAVAHRMVRVLEATVADAAKEFEAAALTAGACEKELESTALPVIEEEGQRLIARASKPSMRKNWSGQCLTH